MRRIGLLLTMSLLVAFLGTVSASAEELPEQIVGCIEVESKVIAKVGINCAILNISTFEPLSYFSTFAMKTEQRELEYTSYPGSKEDCVDVIKLSSGQKIEPEKVFECEIVFVDLDAVGLTLGKKGPLAFELFVEFYPTGSRSLTAVNSNEVMIDIGASLVSEYNEMKKKDYENRFVPLTVNWPNTVRIGIPYKLTVKAGQKYSGTCKLIRTAGAMIQVSNFKIKTGKGSFQLRGLQLGQTRLNLSCKQPSGSGPYAFQIHTLVIVK